MSYTETGDEYTYFTDKEKELIESWLKKHSFTWGSATVCGSCCGFYEDEFWVNGIGGKFPKKDAEKFEAYAKKHGIQAKVDGYTIRATSSDMD